MWNKSNNDFPPKMLYYINYSVALITETNMWFAKFRNFILDFESFIYTHSQNIFKNTSCNCNQRIETEYFCRSTHNDNLKNSTDNKDSKITIEFIECEEVVLA